MLLVICGPLYVAPDGNQVGENGEKKTSLVHK